MENDEKEDLLLEVTDSEDEIYEKEDIDYYIEKKILDYIQIENPSKKSRENTLTFIAACLFMFLSSSVLIIVLPIYLKYSSVASISTYNKLVTLSFTSTVFFIIAHLVKFIIRCRSKNTDTNSNVSFGDVLKISFFLSVGDVMVFWLNDGNYLSCHLRDPLKGCSVIFSLLYYFLFSRKKMSLEKTFCAITIIVGVFISVDFGICDKFHCNGNSNLTEIIPKFHFLYVALYIVAHGIWVLHWALIEVYWTGVKSCNSNLNVSVLSQVSDSRNSGSETMKPSIQSLSIICQEDQDEELTMRKENFQKSKSQNRTLLSTKFRNNKIFTGKGSESSLNNSFLPGKLSVPDLKHFPITSTPNNEMETCQTWSIRHDYDIALWEHLICFVILLGSCWVFTLAAFHNGNGKLLVDVLSETFDSFRCHLFWSFKNECGYLPTLTVVLSISYVILTLTSIEVLKISQSTVTVISVMMAALPIASLFWSLFRLKDSPNILEFSPEITGEAVCAVLGLPIIGIGIVLLMKSHIREFHLVV